MRRDQCREMREIVRECLYSDLDVLLPKMGSTGGVELFFIVAFTDRIGGEAIRKRIQKQLEDSEHLQPKGLTFSSSYRSLHTIQRNATESTEDVLESLAGKIQELINEEISSRMVKNG